MLDVGSADCNFLKIPGRETGPEDLPLHQTNAVWKHLYPLFTPASINVLNIWLFHHLEVRIYISDIKLGPLTFSPEKMA